MKKFLLIIIALVFITIPVFTQDNFTQTTIPSEIHDIITVYNYINDTVPKFDKEFETKKSYKEKIISLDFPELYIFEIENCDCKYNLKKQQLAVTIDYKSDEYENTISVKYTEFKDSYEANNAFGGRVTIERTKVNRYYIRFDNYLPKKTFKYEYAPEEAKRLKDNIKILAFCKLKPLGLAPSFTFDGIPYGLSSPTFDSPRENIIYSYKLCTHLEKILIYDSSNGNIFTEIQATDQK